MLNTNVLSYKIYIKTANSDSMCDLITKMSRDNENKIILVEF